MNDRVDFVCARAEHQGSEPDDVLTMHEELWAYCPAGASAPHDWRPTGGMSLEDAKQFGRGKPIRQIDTTPQPTD